MYMHKNSITQNATNDTKNPTRQLNHQNHDSNLQPNKPAEQSIPWDQIAQEGINGRGDPDSIHIVKVKGSRSTPRTVSDASLWRSVVMTKWRVRTIQLTARRSQIIIGIHDVPRCSNRNPKSDINCAQGKDHNPEKAFMII
jgi:hypothetical protein